MIISQLLISTVADYIKELTNLPVYAVISDTNKELPRIEIECTNDQSITEVLITAREIDLEVCLYINPKDGEYTELQKILEDNLMNREGIDLYIDDQGIAEFDLDYWRCNGQSLEVEKSNLKIVWKIKTMIQ